MPTLARVCEPDRLAVLDDVREDHHLGNAGLLVWAGSHVDLELAELRAEIPELRAAELLAGKAQDAVGTEGFLDRRKIGGGERPRQIEPLDRRAKAFSAWDDLPVT